MIFLFLPIFESGLSHLLQFHAMQKYPDEVRQNVVNLIKNGMPKMNASRKFGISYRTIMDWTSNIRIQTFYPEYLRERVRRLVRRGLSRWEASKITGVQYNSVVRYAAGIGTGGNRVSIAGATLKLLRELVENGYVFDDKVRSNYITLRKYFPVRRVESERKTILYLDGNERTALEAFLKKLDWRSVEYQKLACIRKAFGIKKLKLEYKHPMAKR